MKIVIPGGTGQIGLILSRAFSATGDEVVVLSRNPTAHSACRIVQWDGKTHCGWTKELENADVVINLAGRSVNCRYGKENRREIVDSRVDSVRAVGAAIQTAKPQFVSWIHEFDFVRAVRFLIDNDDLTGVVNICAPNPLPNSEFMRELRRAWGIKIGLPASSLMLEIGAFFMRTETELILKSRRVVPTRLLKHGFEFRFPNWSHAAEELCARYRQTRA